MFPAIHDWSDALLTSAAGGMVLIFGALPRFLAAAIILAAGWSLGNLLARIVGTFLSRVRFAELPGAQRLSVLRDPAHLLIVAIKWLVRLIALVVAFDALGLPAVTESIRAILFWVPHLAVGIVALLFGAYLANAAAGAAARAARSAGLRNPELVSMVARVIIWAFAAIIALHEVGVGDDLVYTLFAGVVALGVVAGGLALGLGGQDIAAWIVARWYGATRGAPGKIGAATRERKSRREFDLETLARRWRRMGLPRATPLQATRQRVDGGRIPEDDVFKELTLEASEMAQELMIAKNARVVDEVRVRVHVSAHEHTVRDTVRHLDASIEHFRK